MYGERDCYIEFVERSRSPSAAHTPLFTFSPHRPRAAVEVQRMDGELTLTGLAPITRLTAHPLDKETALSFFGRQR